MYSLGDRVGRGTVVSEWNERMEGAMSGGPVGTERTNPGAVGVVLTTPSPVSPPGLSFGPYTPSLGPPLLFPRAHSFTLWAQSFPLTHHILPNAPATLDHWVEYARA